ncbi:MAG: nucleotide pyrophosphohydrolase [Ruminococcaceae bacterium]|nr:nucleotide pyrophosphohydrolase [Oscillospiraceae bacterium]
MDITIEALQAYLAEHYCGWATEQSMFMKLVEEIGEVAEVLNKRAGRKYSEETDLQEQLGTELADMIHYIIAIAAINDIDLSRIILEKDKKAAVKYNHATNLETFLSNRGKSE